MPAMGGMLIVSDLDRSLRFYSELLGFTDRLRRGRQRGGRVRRRPDPAAAHGRLLVDRPAGGSPAHRGARPRPGLRRPGRQGRAVQPPAPDGQPRRRAWSCGRRRSGTRTGTASRSPSGADRAPSPRTERLSRASGHRATVRRTYSTYSHGVRTGHPATDKPGARRTRRRTAPPAAPPRHPGPRRRSSPASPKLTTARADHAACRRCCGRRRAPAAARSRAAAPDPRRPASPRRPPAPPPAGLRSPEGFSGCSLIGVTRDQQGHGPRPP